MDRPLPGIDYYLNDDGLMIFTAAFHIKRGYCCESGCRHCPYDKNSDRHPHTGKFTDLAPNYNKAARLDRGELPKASKE
jgi:hypothetical protein